MKFNSPNSSFLETIKEKLLNLLRDEESFGYMKGHEDWEKLIGKYIQCF